jgi:hypothetical protein
MVGGQRIAKDFEGSRHDLIEMISLRFHVGTERNQEKAQNSRVATEIRTRYPQGTRLERLTVQTFYNSSLTLVSSVVISERFAHLSACCGLFLVSEKKTAAFSVQSV